MKSVADLFSTKQLRSYFAKASHLLALDKAMRPHITENMRPHVACAKVEDKCLTVVANSATWATQLQFSADQVLPALQKIDPTIQRLRVIVRPK